MLYKTFKPKHLTKKAFSQKPPHPLQKSESTPRSGERKEFVPIRAKRSSSFLQGGHRKPVRGEQPRPKELHPRKETMARDAAGKTKITQLDRQGEKGKLKIIVLGGCEEIGRNMTVLEYENDIIIIDMGLQFPDENMPGIDYIIPNISCLNGKEDHIRGVIITHGHYDHIGAVSHLIPDLHNPPIYTGALTAGLIQKRHQEFKGLQPLKIQIMKDGSRIQLGKSFGVTFFHINHTIPDSYWIILDTPIGKIVHSGDFKFDANPIMVPPVLLEDVKRFGQTKIRLFMADSTNASKEGHQISEGEVAKEIETIFKEIHGRVIIGTFASNLIRIQSIINIAEKSDRRVMLEGRSLNNYVEVAHGLGIIKFKKGTIITWEDAQKLQDNRIIVICTGAQGERNAVLMRIANHEHKYLTVKKGDTVLFSSSVIPGNERTIQSLRDGLTRAGARVINYEMMDIHAGGHARKEDLRDLIRLVRPEYYMPIEAHHYMLRDHAAIAYEEGYAEDHVLVADNGQVVEATKEKVTLTDKRVPADYVFVDGLGVGDISHIVLRDRRLMAADGMLVVIVTLERKTGRLVHNPDLISRGFIYMKGNKELVEETRIRVKKLLKDNDNRSPAFEEYIKTKIRNDIGQFLYTKTKRRPMILPVLIEV